MFTDMHTNLINLLSHDRIRFFRRTYFLHLLTVAMLAGVLLLVVHGVLLVPTYTYERIVIAKQEERLASFATKPVLPIDKEANDRITLLQADGTYLPRLGAPTSVSSAVRAVLAVPRSGVIITSFSFVGATDQKARLLISGVATSRAALREYILAFSKTPGIESAEVPISSYAAETNIAFSLTLMGPLLP